MKLFDNGGVTMGDLPHINVDATGKRLKRIRKEHNFSVQDIQHQIGLISVRRYTNGSGARHCLRWTIS